MKNKIKEIVTVVLLVNLFIGSIALATNGEEMIEVVFNSINLEVNGEVVKVDNFLYNGTTYAPIREVAEMIGKEVGWDGETNTASINDIQPFTVGEDFMLHGCYAIKSNDQFKDFNRNKTLSNFDSISFGWSRIDQNKDGEVELVFNGQDFRVPSGYDSALEKAIDHNMSLQLMVYADTLNGYFFDDIFANKEELVEQIVQFVNGENTVYSMMPEFDGVTIDFETVRGEDQEGFIEFLKLLDEKLGDKTLYVAVPSVYHNSYYDFEGIVAVADYIIIMEHDYDEQYLKAEYAGDSIIEQPLSPFDKIEEGLNILLNRIGEENANKILLQLSFEVTGWAVKDGFLYDGSESDVVKPINIYSYYRLYDYINGEMDENDIELNEMVFYDERYQNPYIHYYDDEQGIQYSIWYENSESVIEKFKLADEYDLAGISLWRIGTIPNYYDKSGKEIGLDVWNNINDVMNR